MFRPSLAVLAASSFLLPSVAMAAPVSFGNVLSQVASETKAVSFTLKSVQGQRTVWIAGSHEGAGPSRAKATVTVKEGNAVTQINLRMKDGHVYGQSEGIWYSLDNADKTALMTWLAPTPDFPMLANQLSSEGAKFPAGYSFSGDVYSSETVANLPTMPQADGAVVHVKVDTNIDGVWQYATVSTKWNGGSIEYTVQRQFTGVAIETPVKVKPLSESSALKQYVGTPAPERSMTSSWVKIIEPELSEETVQYDPSPKNAETSTVGIRAKNSNRTKDRQRLKSILERLSAKSPGVGKQPFVAPGYEVLASLALGTAGQMKPADIRMAADGNSKAMSLLAAALQYIVRLHPDIKVAAVLIPTGQSNEYKLLVDSFTLPSLTAFQKNGIEPVPVQNPALGTLYRSRLMTLAMKTLQLDRTTPGTAIVYVPLKDEWNKTIAVLKFVQ